MGTTLLDRLGIIFIGVSSTVIAAFAVSWFVHHFHNTSYIFVGAFLIIIILSNILAKLAITYIKS